MGIQALLLLVAVVSHARGQRQSKAIPELDYSSFLQANDPRSIHLQALDKIARSVLENFSKGMLAQTMINQTRPGAPTIILCPSYQPAAAFGRLLAGIAPWMELPVDNTPEGQMRAEYINMTRKAFHNVFMNESCADYIIWNECGSILAEAAYVGHAMLRMPTFIA